MEANVTTGFDGMVLDIVINGGAFTRHPERGAPVARAATREPGLNEFGNPLENQTGLEWPLWRDGGRARLHHNNSQPVWPPPVDRTSN